MTCNNLLVLVHAWWLSETLDDFKKIVALLVCLLGNCVVAFCLVDTNVLLAVCTLLLLCAVPIAGYSVVVLVVRKHCAHRSLVCAFFVVCAEELYVQSYKNTGSRSKLKHKKRGGERKREEKTIDPEKYFSRRQ